MRWILIWAGILLTVTAATGQQPWQQFSDPGIKAMGFRGVILEGWETKFILIKN